MRDNCKDIDKHPEWVKVARRRDDLLYVLLTYGRQLGGALSAVQKEFKKAEQQADRLAKKLEKEGYVAYC